jgi:hypothetical protein
MNHLFIISSSINAKSGEFDSNQRLLQTYHSLKSIYDKIPDARVAVIDSSGIQLEEDVIKGIHNVSHCFIDMSKNASVRKIHDSTTNLDIVKTVSEIMCFSLGFPMLEDNGQLDGIDYIHKLSGRYVLNSIFTTSLYDVVPNKIIVTGKEESTLSEKVGIPYRYVPHIWSWPIEHYATVKSFYTDAMLELRKRIPEGRYADMGHLMYKLLPSNHVQEMPILGVEGMRSSNRKLVSY